MSASKIRRCRGPHPLLILRETNAMGGVVECLQCHDTFQASAGGLAEHYFHAVHIGGAKSDHDFFIRAELVPEAH